MPCLELTRLNRPFQTVLTYLPCATGIVHAAVDSHSQTLSLSQVLLCLLAWLPVSILQSSYAHKVDDIIDQDIDRQVIRSRNQPLPRGAISPIQASVFAALQAISLIALSAWTLPRALPIYPAAAIFACIVYSFGKRFTNYPQPILGSRSLKLSAGSIRGVLFLWVVMVDVLYAFQGLTDDLTAWVKSMSVRFQHATRRLFAVLGASYMLLPWISGVAAGLGRYFYAAAGCAAVSLLVNLGWVDVKTSASCRWRFAKGFSLTAGIVFFGLLGVACQREP
ncbi:uncharacterized protein BO97DRAFT_428581 [Aspergillus homomorphus CBS 101889]|uniref:UbiA prenyltransferase n=1 Tax=Aspergillus homomorphus (strain CBS 101889) TaxID=1450537 RepID=A0A395HKD5_ASPHC|nr:hypothetical protein BO97DRAFT_428581 [Aspergillus homomorphus CBS 101889]RAL08277.1 hypothetical protein BO97DRAFT_428581 [Aspergillus homomorphus CBS 101889]